MGSHYVRVRGGDDVLIDLGGWGLWVVLEPRKSLYDVYYVKISRTTKKPVRLVPADMVLDRHKPGARQHIVLKGADSVSIHRHRA